MMASKASINLEGFPQNNLSKDESNIIGGPGGIS
jgi:hypothetical protein